MIEQRYGKIINMSSIVGLTGSEHGPAAACYSASKAGIISLTRSMAYELAEYNVTVNAAAPGRIATAMSGANNEYYNKRNLNDIPASGGVDRDVISVSYTHLDVYKRQSSPRCQSTPKARCTLSTCRRRAR